MSCLLSRTLVFAPNCPCETLCGMRKHGSPQQLEALRMKAVDLFEEGLETDDIATALDRSRRWVQLSLRTFRQQGRTGLLAKIPPGRKAKLSPQEWAQVLRKLGRGARQSGFFSDLWTATRVRELLKQDYGVEFHVRSIPRLLRRWGYSYQKPQRRAVQRDAEAVEQWLQTDFKRLTKK